MSILVVSLPVVFFNSVRTLIISIMAAVPEDGSIAPKIQASLWLPTSTYRSKNHSEKLTIKYLVLTL